MDSSDIHKACRTGDLPSLLQAVEASPESINAPDRKLGWPPLYRAVICNQFSIAQVLLEHGADPNVTTRLGEGPLHQAADSGMSDFTELLLAYKADPNLQQKGEGHLDGETPLFRAAEKGRVRDVELLIKAQADLNYGRTPLHAAVEFNQIEVVKTLLEHGADRFQPDFDSKTPLDFCFTPEVTSCFQSIPANSEGSDSDSSFTLSESPTLRASMVPFIHSKPSISPTKPIFVDPETSGSSAFVDLNRTFSFGTDYRKSKLTNWLESYKLEGLENALSDAGLDDVEELISQAQSQIPLTEGQLKRIGVQKPGHCARLLAAIEAESQTFHAQRQVKSTGFQPFGCCRKPVFAPGIVVVPSLQDWLAHMGLSELLPGFKAAGYDHLESILALSRTKYALTEEILKRDVGVDSTAICHLLLERIKEDAPRVESPRTKESVDGEDVADPNQKAVACKICEFM